MALLNGDVTWNGKLADEYVLRPIFEKQRIADLFKVVPGIKQQQFIYFLGRVAYITILDPGCGADVNNPSIPRSEKKWDPSPMLAFVKECWTALVGKPEEMWLKTGNDRYKLSDTKYADVMTSIIKDAALEDVQRVIYFGNKTITGSNLKGGSAMVPNYNQINGLWKKVFDGVANSTDPITRFEIANNTAGTTAADQKLDAEDAFNILVGLVETAPIELEQVDLSEKRILVTRSIYWAYVNYLESKNISESFRLLQDGTRQPLFRGIPLTVVDIWDKYIKKDFVIGTPARPVLPHRAIYYAKDNLQIGFDSPVVDDATFEIWDEQKDRFTYARLMYMLDVMIAENPYITVAY